MGEQNGRKISTIARVDHVAFMTVYTVNVSVCCPVVGESESESKSEKWE